MVRIRLERFVRAERLADGTRMRRQICFRHGEVCHAGAIIDRGVIILNASGNRRAELLPIITGRDALSFRGIADEPGLEEDRRDLDVPQNVKARVAHPSIEWGHFRQDRGVNRGGQSDVLAIECIV